MASADEGGAQGGSALAQPRRKRAKHTRSKLGCGVCRIRRVRCDHARPSCERCTSTGRTCDGYPAPTEISTDSSADNSATKELVSRPRSQNLVMMLPGLDFSLNAQAGRSLHFFQHNTALEFAGYFTSDLWSNLVLQVCRRESCVQQMVVALGLLHESFHHDHGGAKNLSAAKAMRQKATNEYALGIKLLNSHIAAQGWASLDITLLCSMLCVAFEWLRGDYVAAQTHLWSSISILSQWNKKKAPPLNGTSLSSPSGHLIQTRLRPACTSLVLQARSMPIHFTLPWHLILEVQSEIEPFQSLQQARHSLDVLLADALPETMAAKVRNRSNYKRVGDIASRLTQWSHHFGDYLATCPPDEASSAPAVIMKLWHTTARILLTACLNTDETIFDDFFPEFTEIVEKTEHLLSSSSTKFSIDIGVVPLLYYVALKCRHPRVRRQAIRMLIESPRREAVWDSLGAACVLQEILQVEENGLGKIRSHLDVPSPSRVCHMYARMDMENRRIRVTFLKQGATTLSEEKVLTW
ncbi:hypothetical protein B0J13DRAFT_535139 [Dactylonectria estremocensis]|uniref:Zn(2)-C6 fungal-type domain-containing protein n=1 Tax=Dactylonectria estremocensis TaxID=1079267 RepID=A0A9P9FHR3_9HYPO|nr:hypothetical protein B0J13DRAFT_535139 [Dactylonectria estremocensis]